jgi:hypothetical protein
MDSKSSSGQIELVLLVPLIIAVLVLNLVLIESISRTNDQLSEMKSEYERLMVVNYSTDPTTGNIYPVP